MTDPVEIAKLKDAIAKVDASNSPSTWEDAVDELIDAVRAVLQEKG